MRSKTRKPSSQKEERTEQEIAQEALLKMKEMEGVMHQERYTIVLSNGASISSTSAERIKEYEEKYAQMGVKVIRRY